MFRAYRCDQHAKLRTRFYPSSSGHDKSEVHTFSVCHHIHIRNPLQFLYSSSHWWHKHSRSGWSAGSSSSSRRPWCQSPPCCCNSRKHSRKPQHGQCNTWSWRSQRSPPPSFHRPLPDADICQDAQSPRILPRMEGPRWEQQCARRYRCRGQQHRRPQCPWWSRSTRNNLHWPWIRRGNLPRCPSGR